LVSYDRPFPLTWNPATDCNGDPVLGYNLYRSTDPEGPFTKVNTSLITETTYTDTTAESGVTYYYAVRSVDTDGDESVNTPELGALAGIGTGTGSTAGGGGGCFIATAADSWE